jgi:hypothetical protein
VCVDNGCDRFVRYSSDFGENIRAVSFDLGVDKDDAVGGDEDASVPASAHSLLIWIRRKDV